MGDKGEKDENVRKVKSVQVLYMWKSELEIMGICNQFYGFWSYLGASWVNILLQYSNDELIYCMGKLLLIIPLLAGCTREYTCDAGLPCVAAAETVVKA